MIRLAVTLNRAGGRPRMLLLGSCTAMVSALLLVVVSYLRLPESPDEILFNLVADPGTRWGTAFAAVLLTLPPLLLLHQAVRLGTAARERRLAALRLAGATPGEVRRLGAIEVGIPTFAGSIAGLGLYWLLRQVLGGAATDQTFDGDGYVSTYDLALVPTSVAPQWWAVLLVIAGATLAGVAVGARASRGVVVTPLGVTRQQTSSPPRPWGLVAIAVAVVLVPVMLRLQADALVFVVVALVVVAIISLAPWAAFRVGRAVETRATSAPLLLAARRLVADPRPAGRASAAVGAIALVAGGATGIAVDLVNSANDDPFYSISLALVGAALLVALVVAIGTLAVHSVESMLDRKRSVASLVALGMPLADLESAQRWEARLVAVPMASVGVLLGALPLAVLVGDNVTPLGLLVVLVGAVAILALVWLAISVAVRLTRPWTISATAAGNLRTE